jgi:transposase
MASSHPNGSRGSNGSAPETQLSASRAGMSSSPPAASAFASICPPVPDPQVQVRPNRRRFSNGYKRRIVKEADACTEPGQIGALLRREGLYSSHLVDWRRQVGAGRLSDVNPEQQQAQRMQQAAGRQKERRRLAHLETENRQLRALLEVQKKLSDLLGIALETPASSERIG